MPKDKREAHYRAVKDGKFNCYECNALLYSGWQICYECIAPLTESTVEQRQLAADSHKERLRLESLLTGGTVENRSAKSQTNVERANFERTVDKKVKENAEAQAKARLSNWEGSEPYQEVEERKVHNGPIRRQFQHLVPTVGFEAKPLPDLDKRMGAKALCERAELIRKFKFESHEQCYWNCGKYRVRCDQTRGKDMCIGPKFFVEFVDTINNNEKAEVYAFDALATDNHRIAFPEHLYHIRERNEVAEKEKLDANSRKRAGSTWPKEAAKSSRLASRQPVNDAVASSRSTEPLTRSGALTAKQYRESTQRVENANSSYAPSLLLSVRPVQPLLRISHQSVRYHVRVSLSPLLLLRPPLRGVLHCRKLVPHGTVVRQLLSRPTPSPLLWTH
jgi:hypothetical protein